MNHNVIKIEYQEASIEQNADDLLPMLRQLQEKKASSADAIEVHETEVDVITALDNSHAVFDHTYRFFRYIHRACLNLLEEQKGEVYCKKCQRLSLAGQLIFERYERGWKDTPLMGGGGRRFYCGARQHLLVEIRDWVS